MNGILVFEVNSGISLMASKEFRDEFSISSEAAFKLAIFLADAKYSESNSVVFEDQF